MAQGDIYYFGKIGNEEYNTSNKEYTLEPSSTCLEERIILMGQQIGMSQSIKKGDNPNEYIETIGEVVVKYKYINGGEDLEINWEYKALEDKEDTKEGNEDKTSKEEGVEDEDSKHKFKEHLGFLSEEFESNGKPGLISSGNGDYGGKSYGCWQFASNLKVPQNFLKWLKSENLEFYNMLSSAFELDNKVLGSNFDKVWKTLGETRKNEFWNLQYKYTKSLYYDTSLAMILEYFNYDISKKSFAMQNVLWSCAVQHGPGQKKSTKYSGAIHFFNKAGLNNSEEDIIENIYNERSKVDIYFKSSSKKVKEGVKARYVKEKKKALEYLKREME